MKKVLGILVLVIGMATAVWAQDYEFVKKWGDCGRWDGAFQYPMGITLDARGNIYVADKQNNSFQKFDPEGNFIARWPRESELGAELYYPYDLAVDMLGYIYIVNSGTGSRYNLKISCLTNYIFIHCRRGTKYNAMNIFY